MICQYQSVLNVPSRLANTRVKSALLYIIAYNKIDYKQNNRKSIYQDI